MASSNMSRAIIWFLKYIKASVVTWDDDCTRRWGRRTCPDTLPGLTGLDEDTFLTTGWHFAVHLIGKSFFSTNKKNEMIDVTLSGNGRKTGKVKSFIRTCFK